MRNIRPSRIAELDDHPILDIDLQPFPPNGLRICTNMPASSAGSGTRVRLLKIAEEFDALADSIDAGCGW